MLSECVPQYGTSALTEVPTCHEAAKASAAANNDRNARSLSVGSRGGSLMSSAKTGEPPFKANSPQALLAAHGTQEPEPVTAHRASVPAPLAQLLMRCLEKKPADRWQSAADLHHALGALATPSQGLTPTDTAPVSAVPRPSMEWKRQRR